MSLNVEQYKRQLGLWLKEKPILQHVGLFLIQFPTFNFYFFYVILYRLRTINILCFL